MLQERLAALEGAAQPYIDSGYVVTTQNDSSLTLVRPRPRDGLPSDHVAGLHRSHGGCAGGSRPQDE
jgi:hypothetical protein